MWHVILLLISKNNRDRVKKGRLFGGLFYLLSFQQYYFDGVLSGLE
jgi:hypothetical protein